MLVVKDAFSGGSRPGPTDQLIVLDGHPDNPGGDTVAHVEGPATVFGVVVRKAAMVGDRAVGQGEFFSRPVAQGEALHVQTYQGRTVLFVRREWAGGHDIIAGRVRMQGDLAYIDGCHDSLLVAPPRLGDACLNALYLPQGVEQSFHTHLSVRIGVVLKGKGFASLAQDGSQEITLAPGDAWIIEAGEVHRFRAPDEPMVIVAYHPDSEWGPTDENHPMLNCTVLPSS